MKGIGPIIIAFIGLVMLITTLTGSAIFLAAKSENILRTARETAIISGINSMEIIKDSLMQSLAYSSYQALYDTSANGGYSAIPSTVKSNNGIADWRVYGDTSGYPINWKANMGGLVRDYLDKYAGRLGVSINYKPVSFSCIIGYCTAKASSDNPLYYTVGFANSVVTKATLTGSEEIFFQLIDKSSMTKKIRTDIQNMFDIARQTFVIDDKVGKAITTAKNSLSGCSEATENYCDTTSPSCDSIYPSDCSTRFTNSINQNIQALKPNAQTDIQTDTRVAYSATGPSKTDNGVDDSCCTRWNPEVCTTDKDGKKTCTRDCAEPHHLWTISCTYDNYAASKVLVTITDTQNKYPVYDSNPGTNDMRNAKLNFYIVSGSDYNEKTRNLIPS